MIKSSDSQQSDGRREREYRHTNHQGVPIELPVGKVVCVGRNYLDHIEELNNTVSAVPLLFMKPSTAVVDMRDEILIPINQGECHNELEVALLIGNRLSKVSAEEAATGINGLGLGLDLTLRDEQKRLKSAGQPWERAKSFDGSCPLSPFVPVDEADTKCRHVFSLTINGQVTQDGDTDLMLMPMLQLVSEISHFFTLLPGDVVLTGTPKGVGPLYVGDRLTATLDTIISVSTEVVDCTREGKS